MNRGCDTSVVKLGKNDHFSPVFTTKPTPKIALFRGGRKWPFLALFGRPDSRTLAPVCKMGYPPLPPEFPPPAPFSPLFGPPPGTPPHPPLPPLPGPCVPAPPPHPGCRGRSPLASPRFVVPTPLTHRAHPLGFAPTHRRKNPQIASAPFSSARNTDGKHVNKINSKQRI